MNSLKPILVNDNINFTNFLLFVINSIKQYLKLFVLLFFLFNIYFFFLKSDQYTSKISFYTNYNEEQSLSALGFVSSMAGITSNNSLGFSISNYVKSEAFLEEIVLKKYSLNDQGFTLVDYWSDNYNKLFSLNPLSLVSNLNQRLSFRDNLSEYDKQKIYAKEKLSEAINYSEDRLTSLHKINITLTDDPELTKQIVQNIYQSIVDYSTSVTNIKATEKKEFILSRVNQIKNDLENSEEELKIFLESNKIISSPSLELQKERIERNIYVYTQLYLTLSDQLEVAKIDEKDTTSSIYLLDNSVLSGYNGSNYFIELFYVNLILLFLIILLSAFINKNTLFIYKQ